MGARSLTEGMPGAVASNINEVVDKHEEKEGPNAALWNTGSNRTEV